MLAALGVVFLYLGALIEVLDLSLAAFASLLVVFAVIELGGGWPWLLYLVTGVLALLLLPQKFGAVVYLLFMGFYPMVKRWAERRFGRWLSLLVKLAVFNLSLLVAWGLARLLLIELSFGTAFWLSVLFLEVTFLLYDFALTRLISLYVFRLRKKWNIKKGE